MMVIARVLVSKYNGWLFMSKKHAAIDCFLKAISHQKRSLFLQTSDFPVTPYHCCINIPGFGAGPMNNKKSAKRSFKIIKKYTRNEFLSGLKKYG